MQSHLHPVWLSPWRLALLLPWTCGELPLPPPLSILTFPCPTFRVESALSLGQCWLSEGNQALCPGTCDTVVVTAVPLDRALRLTLKEWCCQACPGFLPELRIAVLRCAPRSAVATAAAATHTKADCGFTGARGGRQRGTGRGAPGWAGRLPGVRGQQRSGGALVAAHAARHSRGARTP